MSKEFIDNYLEETEEIIKSIDRNEIEKFIDILFNAWKNGNKVITMGNGGSASTASHFAGDLLKTVVNDSSAKEIRLVKGFKAFCLNDNPSSLTAWINDSGWEMAYKGLLNTLLDEGDVVLMVSVHGGSGWSGNIVHAMEFSKKNGAKLIGLAGFDGGRMKELCDSCIIVPKNSTPHTEGFHSVLQHLIIFRLKEIIEDYLTKKSRHKIELFADTADYTEIDYCFAVGVSNGITTNPKIMENSGVSDFMNACESMLIRYPSMPVSLETDLRGIDINILEECVDKVYETLLKQAHNLARLGNNVVIKIPVCVGGLFAVRKLASEGVKTNVTACMTPYQAITAAESGATYVSLFANRMFDVHIWELSGHSLNDLSRNNNWKEIVKANKEVHGKVAWGRVLKQIAYTAAKCSELGCKLIVGSIREPKDVVEISRCHPQIITIPYKIVKELSRIEEIKNAEREVEFIDLHEDWIGNSISHPMTLLTLCEFEKSADSYRKLKVSVA